MAPKNSRGCCTGLQKAFQKCLELSRSNAHASNRFFKELENKVLYISDAEIAEDEVPLLCRFLQCKQVHEEITAVYLVRSDPDHDMAKRSKGGKVIGSTKRTSVLNYDNGKLFKVVFDCLSKCEALESITISAVKIQVDILEIFGRAISNCKSGKDSIRAHQLVYYWHFIFITAFITTLLI